MYSLCAEETDLEVQCNPEQHVEVVVDSQSLKSVAGPQSYSQPQSHPCVP